MFLPILPVDEICFDYLVQGVVLKAHHELDISNHVLYGVILPNFNSIEPLADLSVDDEEDLEVAHQLLLSCLFSGFEGKSPHFLI
jgi:hypothetical protein